MTANSNPTAFVIGGFLFLGVVGCPDKPSGDAPLFHRSCAKSGACVPGWDCVADYPDDPMARVCVTSDAGDLDCRFNDAHGVETRICIHRCRSATDCPSTPTERFECIASWGSGGKECSPEPTMRPGVP